MGDGFGTALSDLGGKVASGASSLGSSAWRAMEQNPYAAAQFALAVPATVGGLQASSQNQALRKQQLAAAAVDPTVEMQKYRSQANDYEMAAVRRAVEGNLASRGIFDTGYGTQQVGTIMGQDQRARDTEAYNRMLQARGLQSQMYGQVPKMDTSGLDALSKAAALTGLQGAMSGNADLDRQLKQLQIDQMRKALQGGGGGYSQAYQPTDAMRDAYQYPMQADTAGSINPAGEYPAAADIAGATQGFYSGYPEIDTTGYADYGPSAY